MVWCMVYGVWYRCRIRVRIRIRVRVKVRVKVRVIGYVTHTYTPARMREPSRSWRCSLSIGP
jgi:hypothetical protein